MVQLNLHSLPKYEAQGSQRPKIMVDLEGLNDLAKSEM